MPLSDQALVLLVHRQMRMFAGPHPDFDDLVQMALEHLLTSRFEGRSRVSTFTHAVCYRVWLKHLRTRGRFLARFGLLNDETIEPTAKGPQADVSLEEAERYQRLYSALSRVSPKRRAVVAMHDLGGLQVDEIANVVGAKTNTVRSRLRDGRRRLAELLREDPYFGDEACSR